MRILYEFVYVCCKDLNGVCLCSVYGFALVLRGLVYVVCMDLYRFRIELFMYFAWICMGVVWICLCML